jgi:PhoPQ-activated pathogenicity-related protein
MLLWNTGGGANDRMTGLGLLLAEKTKSPVAILYHIPNQPLLDNLKEDALIAETFVRAMKTKDDTWPLLLPMVKSVVKAMDALQAFGKQEWKAAPESFVITGASKRGWTTYLTAAADPRVKAIAPMVFDMLNMKEQLPYQVKSFGAPSEQIGDYTKLGLTTISAGDEAANKLFGMVDPWSYREKLTMPKLILLGNNDPYWTVDALNLYWDGLKGDKQILYVPNAGHNLQQKEGYDRVVNALAVFVKAQVHGQELPKVEWKHSDADGKQVLTVTAKPGAKAARGWVTKAGTMDFRKADWKEVLAKLEDGKAVVTVSPPEKGCQAFYGEVEYEVDGLKYVVCTQVRVSGKPEAKDK